MPNTIRLKRGHDIKLVGEAVKIIGKTEPSTTFAVKPPDFKGVWPKLLVKEKQEVKAGSPLFFDRNNEKVLFTSPVSGEIVEILRGDKRIILEIRILADKEQIYEEFPKSDPDSLSREEIIGVMLKSGLWPLILQRPFAKIADHEDKPKSIFISAFDTSPLAPDLDFVVEGKEKEFQTGINILKKLTDGPVHLNVHGEKTKSKVFLNTQGVEINTFYGPHPCGCPGVQIHHIDPVNKNNSVWYTAPQDVISIGTLFTEGKLKLETIIALTGQEVKERKYHRIVRGMNIENLVKNNVNSYPDKQLRYISGNVLNGSKISSDGYHGFYDSQITVIPEGDQYEFMGWLIPTYPRPTLSKTFPWAFQNDIKFKVNTNTNGEKRPFVVTGQYEKVLPMDIHLMFLLKAIMTENLDAMEGLGIYELSEEDVSLCEFVCTSKTPVQQILRNGLDLIEAEG